MKAIVLAFQTMGAVNKTVVTDWAVNLPEDLLKNGFLSSLRSSVTDDVFGNGDLPSVALRSGANNGGATVADGTGVILIRRPRGTSSCRIRDRRDPRLEVTSD